MATYLVIGKGFGDRASAADGGVGRIGSILMYPNQPVHEEDS